MKITRTSLNFPAYLKELGADAVFEGCEKVSIGFRQEKTVDASGNEAFENVEDSGRHPDSGEDLYQAIAGAESLAAFPWLSANGGLILGIFASGLPRNQ